MNNDDYQSVKELSVFKDADELADFAVDSWIGHYNDSLARNGRLVVAFSGGRSPLAFYHKLRERAGEIAWDRVHIFIVDERFVPLDSPQSNFGLLKRSLIHGIGLPEDNLYPIDIRKEIKDSAQDYEQKLLKFFNISSGVSPRFDLIMLGIGEDGHTASLFPKSKALYVTKSLVTEVEDADTELNRITMTLPVLYYARNIIFIVTGEDKSKIVGQILKEDDDFPVSMVIRGNRRASLLIDEKAALWL
ncbi:MAG: 6-phosphogluconolactonase [Candidatus Omnitrophota bacterium]